MAIKKNYLADIEGLCAVANRATMNGRPYDKIWRNILDGKDFRFNEMMKRGGVFVEFGHPSQSSSDFERTETDLTKAAAILTEIFEGDDGKIYAKGKVLDTPSGKIYQAIAPHYNFGFSSRGSYEADPSSFEGPDGWNQDTYVFKGIDLVAIPANEGSLVSATESVKNKKIRSARESLDLNQIAEATNIEPEEIERELDKLFDSDGNLEGSEDISMLNYSEKAKEDQDPIITEVPQGLEPVEPTEDLVDGPMSGIKKDLQTALSEAAKLRQDLESADFDLTNAKAEIERLSSEAETWKAKAEEAEKTVRDFEEIKALSNKLVDSYHGVKDQYDEEKKNLQADLEDLQVDYGQEKEKAAGLAIEMLQIKKSLAAAKEHAGKENKLRKSIEEEFATAKESLIDTYSEIYGVSRKAVAEKLGNRFMIKHIKPVVESIMNDNLRLSSINTEEIVPQRKMSPRPKSAVESLKIYDEYDADLIAMLSRD